MPEGIDENASDAEKGRYLEDGFWESFTEGIDTDEEDEEE